MLLNYRKYQGKEDNFQQSVARYLDSLGVLWCHPPNGGFRNYKTGAILKSQGVKPGIPDILIFEPRGNYHGLMIELKVGTNKTSDYQNKWIASLKTRNYKVFVSYSLDEVIDIVQDYLNAKPSQS